LFTSTANTVIGGLSAGTRIDAQFGRAHAVPVIP
jgi:hypothetical protein